MAETTADKIIDALRLPESCRVDQRVPKKLLAENGAPTSTDKRLIHDGVDEIQWLAALKPGTTGIAEYRDDEREYLEIALLSVRLRPEASSQAKVGRLEELVHRAVPYPVFLLCDFEGRLYLSLANKRWAQNEAGKVVLDDGVIATQFPDGLDASIQCLFLEALPLGQQPNVSLLTVYQGWMDALQALNVARITGVFTKAGTLEQAAKQRHALQEIQQLNAEMARLRAAAGKEKQLARQVETNLELKRLQAKITEVRSSL
ncbi:DUF4391 domain-containing protein [Methylovorus mays]|uniref:DUF4391 domain-containing protein n=1 Tax=Methylovorus mays TaxID=184077 RepID=UPI001E38C6E3|nr:DUF4391 domain-containing protein [Methylovorus mays]MCB5207716.1 DUF4391 domain-containing protein [Methylovorus mays]